MMNMTVRKPRASANEKLCPANPRRIMLIPVLVAALPEWNARVGAWVTA